MRRLLSLLLCVILLVALVGCSSGDRDQAVAFLEQDGVAASGSYDVTPQLLTALESADYTTAKNVIYMIGDGMGFAAVEAAEMRYRDVLYNGKLAMHYLPYQGSSITYSADNAVTDSAAGGTALSAGIKTSNSTIAMSADDTVSYKTLLELAAEQGKSTGVVVTKSVTDATPATFTAHVGSRNEQGRIAAQQLLSVQRGTLDLLLGGGREYFERDGWSATFAADYATALDTPLPLLGLFSKGAMDMTDEALPTLAQMTELALDRLTEDEDGFFLMVEGSQIDTFAHSNKLEESVRELMAFDQAVAVAMRYVALHPDTLLVVTADHETGGLTLPMPLTPDNYADIRYTTGSHTGQSVPVFAAGYGAEALVGTRQNTDIAIWIADQLGDAAFGQAGIVHTVCEDTSVRFTPETPSVKLEAGDLPQDMLPDVILLQVTNRGEKAVDAPTVLADVDGFDMVIQGPSTVLRPGESADLVYMIPSVQRQDVAKGGDVTLSMSVEDGECHLDIAALQYLFRPTGR